MEGLNSSLVPKIIYFFQYKTVKTQRKPKLTRILMSNNSRETPGWQF